MTGLLTSLTCMTQVLRHFSLDAKLGLTEVQVNEVREDVCNPDAYNSRHTSMRNNRDACWSHLLFGLHD